MKVHLDVSKANHNLIEREEEKKNIDYRVA